MLIGGEAFVEAILQVYLLCGTVCPSMTDSAILNRLTNFHIL